MKINKYGNDTFESQLSDFVIESFEDSGQEITQQEVIENEFTDVNKSTKFKIIKEYGILRKSPNHNSIEIVKIKLGEEIESLDIIKGSLVANSDLWIKCEYQTRLGYIHTSYCREL